MNALNSSLLSFPDGTSVKLSALRLRKNYCFQRTSTEPFWYAIQKVVTMTTRCPVSWANKPKKPVSFVFYNCDVFISALCKTNKNRKCLYPPGPTGDRLFITLFILDVLGFCFCYIKHHGILRCKWNSWNCFDHDDVLIVKLYVFIFSAWRRHSQALSHSPTGRGWIFHCPPNHIQVILAFLLMKRNLKSNWFLIFFECRTLQELVEHYSKDSDGLCVNLRLACVQVCETNALNLQFSIRSCWILV